MITPSLHSLFFPPSAHEHGQTLLRISSNGDVNEPSVSKVVADINMLLNDSDAYRRMWDWDLDWLQNGALARACEVSWICKACMAAHALRHGWCPPFL